jgi:hypothetical protein
VVVLLGVLEVDLLCPKAGCASRVAARQMRARGDLLILICHSFRGGRLT